MKAVPGNSERQDQGFTLLELIVVMSILALAGLIAMPLVNRSAGDAVLIATARKMASDMRVARANAIRGNQTRTMTIDLDRRVFWVNGVTSPSGIPQGIAVELLTIDKEIMGAKLGRLRFNADGSSTGGRIVLQAGSRNVTVDLNWMTGHAKVDGGR